MEAGEFKVRVGASSRDIRARASVHVESADRITPAPRPAGAIATVAEFAALLGRPVPAPRPLLPLHADSAIDDLRQTWLGRGLHGALMKVITKTLDLGGDEATKAMMEAVIGQMPMRGIVANAGGKFTFEMLERLLKVVNLAAGKTRTR